MKLLYSVIFITSLPMVLSYIFKRKYKQLYKISNSIDDEEKYYHQVIFPNMDNFQCQQHMLKKMECGDKCSIVYQKTLQNFIRSARISICVCVYMFTLKKLNEELIQAQKRGVNVRIITDSIMLNADPAQQNFSILKRNGVSCKVQNTNGMMHHKFCLTDKEEPIHAKMFFGSLNLTNRALVNNFESVVLTNNLNIIERYSEEFEDLWSTFREIH